MHGVVLRVAVSSIMWIGDAEADNLTRRAKHRHDSIIKKLAAPATENSVAGFFMPARRL
ncbi:hypothetical protein [Bradyrhizobium manausense]|uniref:hypothetical protein n=1 Tax=Bradyrhizobium manausense TaxID=989370 RepID=UPI001BA72E0F|nr:hypothetical protein [Bradyrhizobium manausense]MBR0724465.1 hypothetical protein [Bradyrhizobium manausense]